jgi:signal-transduction protein with cAMP-binding, CBS, and nucleotidyltransferase domain
VSAASIALDCNRRSARGTTLVALDESRLQVFLSRPLSTLELADPTIVQPADRLGDAIATMRGRGDSCALVVENERLQGILTERDVLCRFMDETADWSQPVSAVMTPDPETLDCDEPIGSAIRMINDHDFRTVPMTVHGSVRGLVRLGDILRHLAELYPEEVLNLPPRPDQRIDKPEGA